MKTREPLILTARIAERDLEPFNRLREAHFPPSRNFLKAHLTIFHRLPGERVTSIVEAVANIALETKALKPTVSALRHLGAGVAFEIDSADLMNVRETLKSGFLSWLGPQDMQKWRPHITVQNKVSKVIADSLCKKLSEDFVPHTIGVTGLDLWRYLGGPWRHEATFDFRG